MRYREEVTPGEWETDEHGKRFRRVGNMIEYEMEIHTSGCVVPASQLEDFHKRQKKADEKRKAAALEEWKNRPEPKGCPFSNGMNNQCKREKCVLFLGGRCSIAILADAHGTDQPIAKDAKCPFSVYGRCGSCAMNNNGCAIVRLAASTINK